MLLFEHQLIRRLRSVHADGDRVPKMDACARICARCLRHDAVGDVAFVEGKLVITGIPDQECYQGVNHPQGGEKGLQ